MGAVITSSLSLLLHSFPLFACGVIPQDVGLNDLLQHRSSPWVETFSNRLLEHGSPIEPQVQTENLLQCGLLSFLPELTLLWAVLGLQLSSGHFHRLWSSWSFTSCNVDTRFTSILYRLQRDNLHHYGLHRRLQLQGNLRSVAWGTFSLFLDGCFCHIFLSPLSQLLCIIFTLKYLIINVPPAQQWPSLLDMRAAPGLFS